MYLYTGPGRRPQNTEMDEDFRAPRVYNGPAGPSFSGEDQDLRQSGPPPPSHPKFKPGAQQRQPNNQGGGGYEDYGDMDERMGDTGDYDYRREGMGRGMRGRGAPYNEKFHGRQPGYGNFNAGEGGESYDESGEYDQGGAGWDYRDNNNDGYYDDYDNGYEEEGGYQEPEGRPGPPQPPGRKRGWEEGPGQDRGRGMSRGWGRGAAGDSWGRGTRGGFRGAPRGGGFRGRGGPWQRGGPGGDRGLNRGRGGHRGGY